eukprot:375406_1
MPECHENDRPWGMGVCFCNPLGCKNVFCPEYRVKYNPGAMFAPGSVEGGVAYGCDCQPMDIPLMMMPDLMFEELQEKDPMRVAALPLSDPLRKADSAGKSFAFSDEQMKPQPLVEVCHIEDPETKVSVCVCPEAGLSQCDKQLFDRMVELTPGQFFP